VGEEAFRKRDRIHGPKQRHTKRKGTQGKANSIWFHAKLLAHRERCGGKGRRRENSRGQLLYFVQRGKRRERGKKKKGGGKKKFSIPRSIHRGKKKKRGKGGCTIKGEKKEKKKNQLFLLVLDDLSAGKEKKWKSEEVGEGDKKKTKKRNSLFLKARAVNSWQKERENAKGEDVGV